MSKSSSLSHRVANDLRRDIIAGVLEPGAWLKTEDLAERYAVSANPVREALWRLQGEGFVVANPNQGARVRVVDDDFVRNIFEIREALEPTHRPPLLPARDRGRHDAPARSRRGVRARSRRARRSTSTRSTPPTAPSTPSSPRARSTCRRSR